MGILAQRQKSITNLYLQDFNTVNLEEINRAGLMKRVDHKFLLTIQQLEQVLPQLGNYYAVLAIDDVVNHSYSSTYFDTANFDMYLHHHNKRLNRYKIRQRTYHTTHESFLEVKHKTNRGITTKSRVKTAYTFKTIPVEYFSFINDKSVYQPIELRKTLENDFQRFTLVNQQFTQRITIDTNLQFIGKQRRIDNENLVVAEVKSDKHHMDKTIFNLLKEHRIKPTGMSKYSIGLAMMRDDLKKNLFKQKMNTINKISHVS